MSLLDDLNSLPKIEQLIDTTVIHITRKALNNSVPDIFLLGPENSGKTELLHQLFLPELNRFEKIASTIEIHFRSSDSDPGGLEGSDGPKKEEYLYHFYNSDDRLLSSGNLLAEAFHNLTPTLKGRLVIFIRKELKFNFSVYKLPGFSSSYPLFRNFEKNYNSSKHKIILWVSNLRHGFSSPLKDLDPGYKSYLPYTRPVYNCISVKQFNFYERDIRELSKLCGMKTFFLSSPGVEEGIQNIIKDKCIEFGVKSLLRDIMTGYFYRLNNFPTVPGVMALKIKLINLNSDYYLADYLKKGFDFRFQKVSNKKILESSSKFFTYHLKLYHESVEKFLSGLRPLVKKHHPLKISVLKKWLYKHFSHEVIDYLPSVDEKDQLLAWEIFFNPILYAIEEKLQRLLPTVSLTDREVKLFWRVVETINDFRSLRSD